MRSTKIKLSVVCAAVSVVALSTAWVTGAGAAAPVGSGTASATKSVCGAGTGKKATGKPIKLGGIDMLIPGVDFTTVGKFAAAYFKCVNDNGGINGRPIKYTLYNEQLNPTQQASLAKKLVESDKVVGVVGNTSFTECGTNWKYYKSKGFTVIGAGVQAECFGTPTYVESNMGPRYSNIGAAQALIKRGAKSLMVASPDTISAYADGGVLKVAAAAGIPGKAFPIKLPITDANSTILQLVQAAGQGGGVILDFTPDSAPALMQAAIAQGLVDKVLWGSSTPIANALMAKQFPQFDGKMHINQEFGNINDGSPDENLYLQITKKYAPSISPQAFGQMGFMDAKFATQALMSVKGDVTAASYNAAVRNLKNVKTSMLCKPWYVGKNLAYHIPSNWDITVTYKGGAVVTEDKCFAIQAVDPELTQTRKWEKQFSLNTGK
ncbi:MAG TPA: ABC transporter substrate-binding protein [Gaiellales bacterium]|jgi:branched-chain amino acid transport system substrate-binding protein|nr:ABC transporter substrate-binding protein [Gaiellales bacterium]